MDMSSGMLAGSGTHGSCQLENEGKHVNASAAAATGGPCEQGQIYAGLRSCSILPGMPLHFNTYISLLLDMDASLQNLARFWNVSWTVSAACRLWDI